MTFNNAAFCKTLHLKLFSAAEITFKDHSRTSAMTLF